MLGLNTIRSMLSGGFKDRISARFPKLMMLYNRKLVLDSIGLRKFANDEKDALHLGKGILPIRIFYDPNLSGWLNSEFIDIVCPLLPDRTGITQYPYLEGPYELGNVRIESGDVVFDCGASMGLFSIMCANFDCVCYAFEPLPANRNWLSEVALLNPHINLVPYAISEKDGELWFENHESTSYLAKIATSMSSQERIKVECVSLDSFVEKNRISRVDFIKADIEGAERLLLKGAQNILREFAPKLSICKYHLPDDPQVLRELILDANPSYVIEEEYMKIYAYVP